jgi:hypothetical protein
MASSYSVSGRSQGVSIDNAIKDALRKLKPSTVADELITLKVTDIRINKGGARRHLRNRG